MALAKLKLLAASTAAVLAVIGCAGTGGGMAVKSASGIPLGATGPHAVQPLPDKARFGQPLSEADIAAWNIDIRTPDGAGLPPGRGTVAQGKKIYESRCTACHGVDAKGGSVYGTMVGFSLSVPLWCTPLFRPPARPNTSKGQLSLPCVNPLLTSLLARMAQLSSRLPAPSGIAFRVEMNTFNSDMINFTML